MGKSDTFKGPAASALILATTTHTFYAGAPDRVTDWISVAIHLLPLYLLKQRAILVLLQAS